MNQTCHVVSAGETRVAMNAEHWPWNLDLNESVSVHLYVSPPNADGWPHHTDPYDVTVIQLSGEKTWWFNDGHTVTHEGDRMTIPAGTPHHCIAGPHGSVHLTIGAQ